MLAIGLVVTKHYPEAFCVGQYKDLTKTTNHAFSGTQGTIPKITKTFCTSNTHQAFVWVCIIFRSDITQNSTDKDLPGDKKHTFFKSPRPSLHEMKRYTITKQQIQVQLLF